MPKHKTLKDVRQKLELSHLDSQRELLADDVDLTQLSFITRNLPPLRFDELVVDGEITRTIEGASTVQITINDGEGIIRDSGRLARAVDIKLDGLWFRLVKIQKSGVNMTLTFESREVAILRTYNGRRTVGWGKMRRSRFAQILVQEVKEFKIPFLCPDLEALKNQKIVDAFLPLYVLPGNWPGLTDIGTIDIEDRPLVKSPSGSIVTVESIVITDSGKYVLIPTVVGHAIVSNADATAHYNSTGEYLGKFDTAGHANSYSAALDIEQKDYARRRAIANKGIVPQSQTDAERARKRQEGLGNSKNTNSSTMQTTGGGGVKNQFPPLYILGGAWTGILERGNININARPIVDNPGGGKVSLRPIIYQVAFDYYIIPTVVGNAVVSDFDAQQQFVAYGKHLGKFNTFANGADVYIKALRIFQTEYIKKKTKVKTQGSAKDTRNLAVRGFGLMIKKQQATKEQLDNCERVLDVGVQLGASRKVLVSAIMTIIDESSCYNLDHGLSSSVGIFQELDIWGSVERRMNIELASVRYYTSAMKYDKAHPDAKLWEICHAAQGNKDPKVYAQFGNEANAIVTRYGSPKQGLDNANLMNMFESQIDGAEFQFTRGHPAPQGTSGGRGKWIKEDSWTCLQRLANEVNWRCFEVSGTIYWTTDKQLFKSAPRATISEDTNGINWIDFDYDIGKPTSQVNVDCYIDRWTAPPGSVIEVFDMGPVNGRWLVTEISRPIFDQKGTITLKKPQARLPEPKQNDATSLLASFQPQLEDPFVRTPGRTPNTKDQRPPLGRALREAVLNNSDITWTNPRIQKADIAQGLIDARVMYFLLDFTDAGFKAQIYSLRTGHDKMTTSGNVSAHYTGNAVDLSNFTISTHAKTFDAMTWIRNNNDKLYAPVDQLIGPIPELCFTDGATHPIFGGGTFGSEVLGEHKNHIHVGFAPHSTK